MSLLLIIVALLSVGVVILNCFRQVDEGKIIIWETKYNGKVVCHIGIGPKSFFIFPFWKFKIFNKPVRYLSINSDIFAQYGLSFVYNCAISAVVRKGDLHYVPLDVQTYFGDDFNFIMQIVEELISDAIIEYEDEEISNIAYQFGPECIRDIINVILTSPDIVACFVENKEQYILVSAKVSVLNNFSFMEY